MIEFASSTATDLVAQVSALLADTGLLGVLALVGGVPFGFYAIKKLIGLIPKR